MDTIWIFGDQLAGHWPDWAADAGLRPTNAHILLIESEHLLHARPWHRHKLIFMLAAMRHFAEEMRAAGWAVDLRRAASFASGLRAHRAEHAPGRIHVMQPNNWRAQRFLNDHVGEFPFVVLDDRMFLAQSADIGESRSPLMENFYRRMRRRTGLLMDGDQPAGGKWNYDDENRHPPTRAWRRGERDDIPALPKIETDDITRRTIDEVHAHPNAWGAADGFALPVTRAGAEAWFADFIAHRLGNFGAYEDAVVSEAPALFHSVCSPLLNVGLLDPLRMCRAVEQAWRSGHAPLASAEAFVRQIIGWREFVRLLYLREMPQLRDANALDAQRPLPHFYWDADTDMACVRDAVQGVWQRGYAHHIQRLMVLCNFAMLAGVRPQEVNDWFLTTFVDAYDWVVTPNVIGMGLFADGGIVGTKPYAAGANYLNRMGTACRSCRFDPEARIGDDACPFNSLYWDFVARHAERLGRNPRTSMPVRALQRMPPEDVAALRQQAAAVMTALH
jgi:deoxyribodipyrimidine photolyase-related protein